MKSAEKTAVDNCQGKNPNYKEEYFEQYIKETNTYNSVINRVNIKDTFYNGLWQRYKYPVVTRAHVPLFWRYDLNPERNPYFMERLGINAVFNAGAIHMHGKFYLMLRVEGYDRKSFFALAESENGTHGFRFQDYPVEIPDTEPEETNVYDMRLTHHEDGYIYGVFCSECHDKTASCWDTSAAVAQKYQGFKKLGTPAQSRNIGSSATQCRFTSRICEW